ncbi:hypothetical protein ACRRTK_020449 [Alexandromys fortis]
MARSPGGRCALLLLLLLPGTHPLSPRGDSTGPDLRRPRGGTALGPTCSDPEVGQNWARPPATPRWDRTGPDLRQAE